jgi:hypothetical protein
MTNNNITKYYNNVPTKHYSLIPEALRYLAHKILTLREIEEGKEAKTGYDNKNRDMALQELSDYTMAKDLEENAERLEAKARDFTELIRNLDRVNERDDLLNAIDQNDNLISFALELYAKDIKVCKEVTEERLKRIGDSIDNNYSVWKNDFYENYCRTEHSNNLLNNIEEFKRRNLGKSTSR